MPKIPEEKIESILNATDIVELVTEHVPLKKAGANYKGLCPFHGEKTPSFVVSPDKQIFHCFGCHAGGDALGFVMKVENLTFVEVVKKLAERARIAIDWEKTEKSAEDPQKIYYRINSYALWFFRQQLEASAEARDYAKSRHLSPETVEKYELGFAPPGFENLLEFFADKKIPLEKAMALGLVKKGERRNAYDFFRNRLIFPIRSRQGDVIGFGGRTLLSGGEEAKYINSAESPIYHKSRELYGLYQAKKDILKMRQVLVVEGYVDVVACSQLGVLNAVAPLGTSLTEDQIKIIRRMAEEIVLMFDGDAAGQQAALKAARLCLQQGVHPRVVILPGDCDPGDYLKNGQDGELKELIEKAPQALDWVLSLAVKAASARPGEQAKTVQRLAEWLSLLQSPIERLTYERQVEQYFGVSLSTRKKVVENRGEFASALSLAGTRLGLEELVILALLTRPGQCRDIRMDELIACFANEQLKDLAAYIEKKCKNDETSAGAIAIRQMPEEFANEATRILASGSGVTELSLKDLGTKLKRGFVKAQLKNLTAEILAAQTQQDAELLKELLGKKQQMLRQEGLKNS